jgi:hypothetical protein
MWRLEFEVCDTHLTTYKWKNKFWEELVAYFLSYETTPPKILRFHGNIYSKMLPTNDKECTHPETRASSNYSIVAYILCSQNLFAEPLSSNERKGKFYRAVA